MLKNKHGSKYFPLILLVACLLVAVRLLIRNDILNDRNTKSSAEPILISVHDETVTADNCLISYVTYDSLQSALEATPVIVLGEIVEMIQPFDRLVDRAVGSPEYKIAEKLNSKQEIVVKIAGYRIRVIESLKGSVSAPDMIISYNCDLFDQSLPLDLGDQLVWTVAESPQPVSQSFTAHAVYTFITPGLSVFHLSADQCLVPLCREANSLLFENLSLQALRALSAGE